MHYKGSATLVCDFRGLKTLVSKNPTDIMSVGNLFISDLCLWKKNAFGFFFLSSHVNEFVSYHSCDWGT
jgi:hypothetical protein